MILAFKQKTKQLNKEEHNLLLNICHIAKNLYNESLYNIRQHYFKNGTLLDKNDNLSLLSTSENISQLSEEVSSNVINDSYFTFKSFLALKKAAKYGKVNEEDVKIPKYFDKDGYKTIHTKDFIIKDNVITINFYFNAKVNKISIKLTKNLYGKKILFIKLKINNNAKKVEIIYYYCIFESRKALSTTNAMAIDLGVNNLATCVTSQGHSFIIDGKRLKSINQFYNKETARLNSIYAKQNIKCNSTKLILRKIDKHNNVINDYLNKTCKLIIDYCLKNDIGVLVVGYNKNIKSKSKLGNVSNQNFHSIPHYKLINKLNYKCKLSNIRVVVIDESYTSLASFYDFDRIPDSLNDGKEHKFSGERVCRGLYKTRSGRLLNADVNGALNILKKSKVVRLTTLYNRGVMGAPTRIKIK